jgi:hypothetical protein
MKQWIMLAVLVMVLAAPASKLMCQVRMHKGRAVCWCKSDQPGGRLTTYPMFVCWVTGG